MKRPLGLATMLPILAVAMTTFVIADEIETQTMATHIMMTPDDVKWEVAPSTLPAGAMYAVIYGDPKVEGARLTLRMKLPRGWIMPPHFHHADEQVTVLSGILYMGMGDVISEKESKAIPAGGIAVMPRGEHHFAWAKGETIVQIHTTGPWGITYVNPKDDPQATATHN